MKAKKRPAAGKDVRDGHGLERVVRRYRVVAPHVPYFRGEGKRAAEIVIASYPFDEGKKNLDAGTYDFDEGREVLAIFTRTWLERGWPADFEPVMVSADDGPPEKFIKRELDARKDADQYLRALSAV